MAIPFTNGLYTSCLDLERFLWHSRWVTELVVDRGRLRSVL